MDIPIVSCTKCQKEYPQTEEFFYVRTKNPFVLRKDCKGCVKESKKQYYHNNSDIVKEKSSKYYHENSHVLIERRKKYYLEHPDKVKEAKQHKKDYAKNNKSIISKRSHDWYVKNCEKVIARASDYTKTNKERVLKKRKEYYLKNRERICNRNRKYRLENNRNRQKRKDYMKVYNKRYRAEKQKDPVFKLKKVIGDTIRQGLLQRSSSKKNKSCWWFLEYSASDLRVHLESQFESWMTWDNWGRYNPETWDDNDPSTWRWQIDHLRPHSLFRYDSMEHPDFKDCWALSNLRPLSAKQNVLDGMTRSRHNQ